VTAWQVAGGMDQPDAEAHADWLDRYGGMTPAARFMEEHGLEPSDLAEDRP